MADADIAVCGQSNRGEQPPAFAALCKDHAAADIVQQADEKAVARTGDMRDRNAVSRRQHRFDGTGFARFQPALEIESVEPVRQACHPARRRPGAAHAEDDPAFQNGDVDDVIRQRQPPVFA
ncbi:hypothetical protein D3C87_1433310 [compost metagenome]